MQGCSQGSSRDACLGAVKVHAGIKQGCKQGCMQGGACRGHCIHPNDQAAFLQGIKQTCPTFRDRIYKISTEHR